MSRLFDAINVLFKLHFVIAVIASSSLAVSEFLLHICFVVLFTPCFLSLQR